MSQALLHHLLARWALRAHGLLTRPMTLGVRALALDESDRVFLVRHTYAPGFYLAGGGVEPGETALEALKREIAEEGGLIVVEPPRLIGFFHNPLHSRRDHVALYFVRVRQDAPLAPNWEIAESGFFPLDALPEASTTATRARIAEYLGQATPNSVW
jgi:ADP-ribose pyrophosphatase YjhB (NUDIX family)